MPDIALCSRVLGKGPALLYLYIWQMTEGFLRFESGPPTISQEALARNLGWHRSYLKRTLSVLVKDGWVEKIPVRGVSACMAQYTYFVKGCRLHDADNE